MSDTPLNSTPPTRDLTVQAAADLAGVSVDTIRRRIHLGVYEGAYRVRGRGPGGQWRIPAEALDVPIPRLPSAPSDSMPMAIRLERLKMHIADLEDEIAERDAVIEGLRAQLSDRRARSNYTLDVLRSVPQRIVSAVATLPPWRRRNSTPSDG